MVIEIPEMSFLEKKLKETYKMREEVLKENGLTVAQWEAVKTLVPALTELDFCIQVLSSETTVEEEEVVSSVEEEVPTNITPIKRARTARVEKERKPVSRQTRKKARRKRENVQVMILEKLEKKGEERRKALLGLGQRESSSSRALRRLAELGKVELFEKNKEEYVRLARDPVVA